MAEGRRKCRSSWHFGYSGRDFCLMPANRPDVARSGFRQAHPHVRVIKIDQTVTRWDAGRMLDKPTPPKGGGRRRAAAAKAEAHRSLPDLASRGPFRPFVNDPGGSEQYWWLWPPVAMAAALLVIFRLDATFYLAWILPEGYGFLEFTQFVVAGAAALLAFSLLFNGYVRSRPLILAFLALSGLACLYIAGEEMSWGQHLFHWTTPAYWAELNRQQETN